MSTLAQRVTNLEEQMDNLVSRSACKHLWGRNNTIAKSAETKADAAVSTANQATNTLSILEESLVAAISRISDLEDELEKVVLPEETQNYMNETELNKLRGTKLELEKIKNQVVNLIRKANQ